MLLESFPLLRLAFPGGFERCRVHRAPFLEVLLDSMMEHYFVEM